MSIKLDFGCGGKGSHWTGFIGVDILPPPAKPHNGMPYFQLDLVNDLLPWKPGSVDEIIALHLIEHVEREQGRKLISRGLELLKPGGKFIITCPDLRIITQRYLDGNLHVDDGNTMSPNCQGEAMADRFNWQCHSYGHVWQYDQQSLELLALEAGCFIEDVRPVDLNGGCLFAGKKDHECGIVILARGSGEEAKTARKSMHTISLELRVRVWGERIDKGLKNK